MAGGPASQADADRRTGRAASHSVAQSLPAARVEPHHSSPSQLREGVRDLPRAVSDGGGRCWAPWGDPGAGSLCVHGGGTVEVVGYSRLLC